MRKTRVRCCGYPDCSNYYWGSQSKYCEIHRGYKRPKAVYKIYKSFRRANKQRLKEWSIEVRRLKGNNCLECGKPFNSVHHIIPVAADKSLAFDINNGIPLCKDCHISKHPELPASFLS